MLFRTNPEATTPATPVTGRKGVPSVISGDLHILGSLMSDGVIDVDGNIEGNIKADQVTIRPNGKVRGDIVAQTVHIYGEVRGLVRALSVFLYSSCHIEGIVMHQSLTVEDGAFIDGKFKRLKDKASLETESAKDDDDETLGVPALAANLRLIG